MELQNKQSIQDLVKEIQAKLIERGEMLATAESCTGGLIASEIVNVAGSSAVLAGGIVAYQNSVKQELLGNPYCPDPEELPIFVADRDTADPLLEL